MELGGPLRSDRERYLVDTIRRAWDARILAVFAKEFGAPPLGPAERETFYAEVARLVLDSGQRSEKHIIKIVENHIRRVFSRYVEDIPEIELARRGDGVD